MPLSLDDLCRFTVARSLFPPTTLKRAIDRLGFVQADPIRAPARAQDLTLGHRVKDYRAGDLERRYAALGIEEDFLINYGFVSAAVHELMHPRTVRARWPARRKRQAEEILTFVRERGAVHPREVDDHFSHGTVTNYWGGSSSATTHLLDAMHYRGLLRVVGREQGIRLYAARHAPELRSLSALADESRLDALIDVVVRIYAPLPAASLSSLISRLRYGVPQWHHALRRAVVRTKARLAHGRVAGVEWYWPAEEDLPGRSSDRDDGVRLLAPFDPVVWDRRRFEQLWGWAYRFEVVHARRETGARVLCAAASLARPGDRLGNVSMSNGELHADFGYVESTPRRDRAFARALDDELDRMRRFSRRGAASVASVRAGELPRQSGDRHHEPPGSSERQRAAEQLHATVREPPTPAEPPDRGQRDPQQRQLHRQRPAIERQERDRCSRFRNDLIKPCCQSESLCEAEGDRHEPSAGGVVHKPVFETDVQDRDRNRWFEQSGARLDAAECRDDHADRARSR